MSQKKLIHPPPSDTFATPTQNCGCRFIGEKCGFWNPWTERAAKNTAFSVKWNV